MRKRIVVSQQALARIAPGIEDRVHARLEKIDVEGKIVSARVGEVTVVGINNREIAIGEWSET